MTAVDRNALISFVAGSLYGESPLSLEDAVTGALNLVDQFDDHGWTVHADGEPVDDDDIKIEFDPAIVPRWLSVGGKRYDVVEPAEPQRVVGGGSDLAVELAERFDEREQPDPDREISGPLAESLDRLAEQERSIGIDEPLTLNDHMVSIQGSGEGARLRWLGSDGVSRETALRHAAWIVAMADPLEERFGKILRAVMST